MEISLILNNKQVYEKTFTSYDVMKLIVFLLLAVGTPAFKTVPNFLRI